MIVRRSFQMLERHAEHHASMATTGVTERHRCCTDHPRADRWTAQLPGVVRVLPVERGAEAGARPTSRVEPPRPGRPVSYLRGHRVDQLRSDAHSHDGFDMGG